MEILIFVPALILNWLFFKLFKKLWRLFAWLFFAALISGCASTSNTLEKSPCACDFEPLNIGNFGGQADA